MGRCSSARSSELQAVLSAAVRTPSVEVWILRLRRASLLDLTAGSILATVGVRLADQGRRLLLVGMEEDELEALQRLRVAGALGDSSLFPTGEGSQRAPEAAVRVGLEAEHRSCGPDCALKQWLWQSRDATEEP